MMLCEVLRGFGSGLGNVKSTVCLNYAEKAYPQGLGIYTINGATRSKRLLGSEVLSFLVSARFEKSFSIKLLVIVLIRELL